MPAKKTTADIVEKTWSVQTGHTTKSGKGKTVSPEVVDPGKERPAEKNQEVVSTPNATGERPGIWWLLTGAAVFFSLVLGFVLSYSLQVLPLQDQLAQKETTKTEATVSSNQIQSDLSTTRLRQQEMEIRYLKASAELERANKHIFLLKMKEQVVITELMIEQKNGMEARNALAELKTQFDNFRPYILEKNKDASEKLEGLIQTAIQDLTGDPDTAIQDMEEIREALRIVETALF